MSVAMPLGVTDWRVGCSRRTEDDGEDIMIQKTYHLELRQRVGPWNLTRMRNMVIYCQLWTRQ